MPVQAGILVLQVVLVQAQQVDLEDNDEEEDLGHMAPGVNHDKDIRI